jgi:hypothetical protein
LTIWQSWFPELQVRVPQENEWGPLKLVAQWFPAHETAGVPVPAVPSSAIVPWEAQPHAGKPFARLSPQVCALVWLTVLTPAASVVPQQLFWNLMMTQSEADVQARSEGSSSPVWVKQAGVVGHGANSQFGPVRPTELPSGHTIASVLQATGVPLVPLVVPVEPLVPPWPQARTVHMMPSAAQVQSLQPSGDLKLSPTA